MSPPTTAHLNQDAIDEAAGTLHYEIVDRLTDAVGEAVGDLYEQYPEDEAYELYLAYEQAVLAALARRLMADVE